MPKNNSRFLRFAVLNHNGEKMSKRTNHALTRILCSFFLCLGMAACILAPEEEFVAISNARVSLTGGGTSFEYSFNAQNVSVETIQRMEFTFFVTGSDGGANVDALEAIVLEPGETRGISGFPFIPPDVGSIRSINMTRIKAESATAIIGEDRNLDIRFYN